MSKYRQIVDVGNSFPDSNDMPCLGLSLLGNVG